MIPRREINTKAEAWQIPKTTVDKDWLLSHFVQVMFASEATKNALVFKGGTSLRKCYFENYRFSEDLDFTIVQEGFEMDHGVVSALCKDTQGLSGAQLHIKSVESIRAKDHIMGSKAIVPFWGANHERNKAPAPTKRWNTSIKLEAIAFERMLFPVVNKDILHPYSDHALMTSKVPCYDLREVMSEKLRAFIQRSYTAPRDYYDVWYLSQNHEFKWSEIKEAFLEKMAFKDLDFEGTEQMINPKTIKTLKSHWGNNLGHHLPDGKLPDPATVVDDLQRLIKTIF